jgi:competence protein ComEC
MRSKILMVSALAVAAFFAQEPRSWAQAPAPAAAQAPVPAKETPETKATLDIYVVDVEGGNAVLFVAPSGESVLIDTGNVGTRDGDRVLAAAKDAGLTAINHVIITHYHGDHFGGLAEISAHIPIKEVIDHGVNVQVTPATDEFFQKTYLPLLAKTSHMVVKPGDKIAVKGLDWRIVSAGGQVLKTPLPGAGKPNPYCAETKPHDADSTEDAQSVGSFVTFGKFRTVHMGDLGWNKEIDLMCPVNRLGTVDLLLVGHHGLPTSSSPAMVHALAPRVAIMNNGTRKGGQPDAMKVIFSSPGLEDLWQMHFSVLSGQEYTVPGLFIANGLDAAQENMPVEPQTAPAPGPGAPPPPQHEGTAYWIKVSAQPDGTFTVTNTRNGFSKTYEAHGK